MAITDRLYFSPRVNKCRSSVQRDEHRHHKSIHINSESYQDYYNVLVRYKNVTLAG